MGIFDNEDFDPVTGEVIKSDSNIPESQGNGDVRKNRESNVSVEREPQEKKKRPAGVKAPAARGGDASSEGVKCCRLSCYVPENVGAFFRMYSLKNRIRMATVLFSLCLAFMKEHSGEISEADLKVYEMYFGKNKSE